MAIFVIKFSSTFFRNKNEFPNPFRQRGNQISMKNSHLQLLKSITKLSHSRLTPLMAVVFNTIIWTLMVLPPSSDIENLLDYFSFAMWTIYALTFISIIILRYTAPYKSIERPFKVSYF